MSRILCCHTRLHWTEITCTQRVICQVYLHLPWTEWKPSFCSVQRDPETKEISVVSTVLKVAAYVSDQSSVCLCYIHSKTWMKLNKIMELQLQICWWFKACAGELINSHRCRIVNANMNVETSLIKLTCAIFAINEFFASFLKQCRKHSSYTAQIFCVFILYRMSLGDVTPGLGRRSRRLPIWLSTPSNDMWLCSTTSTVWEASHCDRENQESVVEPYLYGGSNTAGHTFLMVFVLGFRFYLMRKSGWRSVWCCEQLKTGTCAMFPVQPWFELQMVN